ncbi:methyltransferase domain-containing protein [Pasteuria penetrans]|uniref:methyltransferase domain-containing protein n=1 Tax=Pasteuria penetrans TaxID=86005 RepID=UPI000FB0194E|nr:methyltransferase domain-containing protein [Pasteuria penetrans]
MLSRPRIVLSMVVRNEADRHLERVLLANRRFVDAAVIIDDASTDSSVEICRDVFQSIPLTLILNEQSRFANEVSLRRQQWEATIELQPHWILNLDADEILESSFLDTMDGVLGQKDYDAVYFRLYDMWDEDHYREDIHWNAHKIYRPFLVRYKEKPCYKWKDVAQHCGRFPLDILHFPYCTHSARVLHYGWASPEDRQRKYARYKELDKDARYGFKSQYESILDENPRLMPLAEEPVLNSRAYWEHRFKTDWVPNGGPEQVAFHGRLALGMLPQRIKENLENGKLTLCDVGCASGEATNIWSQAFPEACCVGVDFAERAIGKAKRQYGSCDFVVCDLRELPDMYDVVFASHVLHLFHEPIKVVHDILLNTVKYLVILVSFSMNRLPLEHQCRLDYTTFPFQIGGAQLVVFRVKDCANVPGSMWGGEQALVVYAKMGEMDMREWNLADCLGL